MFKHISSLTALCLALVLLLTACAASVSLTQDTAADTEDSIQLPTVSEPEEEVIPQLEPPDDFAAAFSEPDTAVFKIAQYDMNYTVENADGARMVMQGGRIVENGLKVVPGFSTVDDDYSETGYEVPFSPRYKFSYECPHEACGFDVTWSKTDLYMFASGAGIETVESSLSGVRLTGEDMEYMIIYYVGNEDRVSLTITGAGESAVCLMRTEDGFRFYCENGATLLLRCNLKQENVQMLEVPAGQIGVVEHMSAGYDAILYAEPG